MTQNATQQTATRILPRFRNSVLIWLLTIAAMVTIMVSIGGVTRLTGSGLSITDWSPIMGAIPPLNEAQWLEAFAKYQASPQGMQVNHAMELPEFKFIFFWEYFHRLIGRLLGFVVLIPLTYFWVKKRIDGKLAKKVLIGFALGGLQGVMGWFMVMSGLVDMPSVSHFRLAAHLSLALIILSYFVWIIRDYWIGRPELLSEDSRVALKFRTPFRLLVVALIVQIIYGAFVAGLKAGLSFNTFPLMAGEWMPGNVWAMDPTWLNVFENPAMLQWIHRWIGTAILLGAAAFYIGLRRMKVRDELKLWGSALTHMIFIQFLLGVATLVYQVPVALAVLHQFGAAILVILMTCVAHVFSRVRDASRLPSR